MNIIDQHKQELMALCTKYMVQELYVFGSVLTNDFGDESDVDFLIQFGQIELLEYFDNYMDLKEGLEALLHRKVDLVERQAIKNPVFRKNVEQQKQLVYLRS